jgi:hypothetical protein
MAAWRGRRRGAVEACDAEEEVAGAADGLCGAAAVLGVGDARGRSAGAVVVTGVVFVVDRVGGSGVGVELGDDAIQGEGDGGEGVGGDAAGAGREGVVEALKVLLDIGSGEEECEVIDGDVVAVGDVDE